MLTSRGFYDFEGKYLGGDGVDVVCPAELTTGSSPRCRTPGSARSRRSTAADSRGSTCSCTPDGGLVVNELNTMPGFTPISMFPRCWIASGLSYRDLITELIEAGLRR